MKFFLFFILLLLVSQCCSAQNCRSLPVYTDSNGSFIVNGVLMRIECLDLFETFNYKFMRRLAYVETKDGREMQNGTGIWNVPQHQLSNANFTDLSHEMACKRLGVNLREAVLNPGEVDFSNPMVSGVIATFYIHYVVTVKKKTIPSAENVKEQAMFWFSEYKMNDTAITLSHFTERVEELEGIYCMNF